jgi:hypothetical protein
VGHCTGARVGLKTPCRTWSTASLRGGCRMDLPEPTTSVGTSTDYSVGPWDYSACSTRHLISLGRKDYGGEVLG